MDIKKRKERFLNPNDDEPMFGLYQLKHSERLRDLRFTDFRAVKKLGKKVERKNYELVYAGEMDHSVINLDGVYLHFNIDRPTDFTGHSVSVSDVIVYKYKGNDYSSHFVDSVGYELLNDFMHDAEKPPHKKKEMEM